MGTSGQITTAKLETIEKWCRTAAFLITKPMNIMEPRNVRKQLLDSLDEKQLRYLAKYFNRCTKVSKQASLIGKSRRSLLEIIASGVEMIQAGEATLMLPFEFEHFITSDVMAARVGKGANKEFIAEIEERCKTLINAWSIYLPGQEVGKGFDGSEVIVYATKHNHTRYYISPELQLYFADLTITPPMSLSEETRADYLNTAELLSLVRGGNDRITSKNIEDLKAYLEKLMKSDANLSVTGGNLPATEHILWRSYSAVNKQTFYISKQAVPYILYNYCCPRSKLENGHEFITNTEICRVIGVEKIKDHNNAIQSILGEIRGKRAHETISIEKNGETVDVKIGDVIRKLSAKRIEPSFFIHRDAVEALISKADVIARRNEIKQLQMRWF